MAKQDDGLFLLEVLVDKICFVKSPCFSDKDFRTCVNIQALSVDPLEICDDDPGVCIAKSGGPFVKTFNSGKSCLFSLKESEIATAMSKFPVKVSVYKSLPCGCLPTKIIMGEATIDMTKEFVQARNKFLEDPTVVSYQALKDSFRIVAPEGGENGDITMFLRISCFGKLIITKFQGAGGPPNLEAGGASKIADRSCNPRRDFQSTRDPCVCGAARAAGAGTSYSGGTPCLACGRSGPCPISRHPYNSSPCEDTDDICYCSGPKPAQEPPSACRNTDLYCLHVPKGAEPRSLFCRNLREELKLDVNTSSDKLGHISDGFSLQSLFLAHNDSQAKPVVTQCIQNCFDNLEIPMKLFGTDSIVSYSLISENSRTSTSHEFLLTDVVNFTSNPSTSHSSVRNCNYSGSLFNNLEITVYMALFDDCCPIRTFGTQATASINKCLQVTNCKYAPSLGNKADLFSATTMSTKLQGGALRKADVYFFGRKKNEKSGMGGSDSKGRLQKNANTSPTPVKTEKGSTEVQAVQDKKSNSTVSAQTNKTKGASAATSTAKSVCISDSKGPCPAIGTKGDMLATVSHIRIGPGPLCPFGSGPCQGPKCIIAAADNEQNAPVKVTQATNPRRGVFEIVIRRMTGSPLAKNELMLEWTPPSARPCGSPFPTPCTHLGPCRPSRCKMMSCRSSSCKPRCKKPCKKPCSPSTGRPLPCCGTPCRPPPRCRPSPCPPLICRPRPCRPSCRSPPCRPPPCRASPCRPSHCYPSPCRRSPCVMRCGPRPIGTGPCGSAPCYLSPCGPPSCRAAPCRPAACRPAPCRPNPCRPASCCTPSCLPLPCGPAPCKRSCKLPKCCGKPCRTCKSCKPCKLCQPPRCKAPCASYPYCRSCQRCKPCVSPVDCRPCPSRPRCCGPCPSPPPLPCAPSPCQSTCALPCCSSPCKSSPCLRPCPVGRPRRTRKARSQPRIKRHKKHISPCLNRSDCCPVVRSRSVPGACIECCGPARCAPRKCCSVFPFKPTCCKSSCNTCGGA